jgi:hypothetical protein
MLVFPCLKLVETLIDGLYLSYCPWFDNGGIISADRYIDMARITIITVTYTIFLAVLYLMSKGWNTISFNMSRS